jgi:hyaluronan synthase
MFPDNPKYPVPKPDRRQRSLSRPNASDRRQTPRFQSSFPVKIYIGEGASAQVYHAIARDVSDGGLLLENVDIPLTENRVRVNFTVPEGTMPEEYSHGNYTFDSEVRRRDAATKTVGLQFRQPISMKLAKTTWQYMRWIATLGLLVSMTLILLIKLENVYYFWFDVPVFLYSLAVGSYLISRFVFSAFYRTPRPRSGDLPTVSVIFPVFNEEFYIERTLVQALEVAYPRDKLQIIAVNDGSRDNTFATMQKVQQKYPEIVLVSLEKLDGQTGRAGGGGAARHRRHPGPVRLRQLLPAGCHPPHRGRLRGPGGGGGDRTLRCGKRVVQPAHQDAGGALLRELPGHEGGRERVRCRDLPVRPLRGLSARGVHGGGGAVAEPAWMGAPATFGDDRSLTNFMLQRGHKVIYDARARCTTIVPEDYRTFYRQQLRWKRSWLRESLRACSFMWRFPPLASLSFYLGFLLPLIGPAGGVPRPALRAPVPPRQPAHVHAGHPAHELPDELGVPVHAPFPPVVLRHPLLLLLHVRAGVAAAVGHADHLARQVGHALRRMP